MNVSVTTTPPTDLDTDLLLIPLTKNPSEAYIDVLADALGDAIRRAIGDFEGAAGEALLLYPENAIAPRAALLGLGDMDALDTEPIRQAAAAGADVATKRAVETVAILLPEVDFDVDQMTQALVEGFVLGAYQFREHKTDEPEPRPETILLYNADGRGEEGAQRGRVAAQAACTARDLVNRSPDKKTAPLFAESIQASGAAHGYDVGVWDKARIEEEGMGGLLAVNRGSFEPPTFSVLTWAPDNAVNDRPVVLVGKGVVFDTGGLSLKDTKDSMDLMKSDMAGAAAVVGAFEAIADLELPLHVVGLVPATDNRPGHRAYVPGDVIRMHSGTTVEVLNTDAEGRMLLADALSYAQSLGPELVVDLATLTGAVVIALGNNAAGVMTREDEMASERLYAMQRAGERTGERVHPLPMYAEYKKQLESTVADLKNVGGRAAGSITAGKFLEHFTDYPWLHLDIAGMAYSREATSYRPQGGTGFGVRLLADFLKDYAQRKQEA
jgi:leucyl aminopeptidase